MTKLRVGVIFGGKSAEHEVSLQSAKNILDAIDKEKFDVTLLGIDKQGQWHLNDASNFLLNAENPALIALNHSNKNVALVPGYEKQQLIEADGAGALGQLDVVFPIVHGTLGEDGSLQGLLRIGCLSTLAPRYLPSILVRMRELHPHTTLEVQEADTETLLQMLERGALDAALLYDMGLARKVQLETMTEFVPYALLPAGHRLAQRASLGLAALAQEPLVLIKLPHSREYFLSLFRQAGVTPRIAYETPSIEMLRSLVANGLGVSLLTTRPVRDWAYDGKRLACRRLRGALTPQSVVLAYPDLMGYRNPRAQQFADVARGCFEQLRDALTSKTPPTP